MSRKKGKAAGALPALFCVWYAFLCAKLASQSGPILLKGLLFWTLPYPVPRSSPTPLLELLGGYALDGVYLASLALSALGFGMPLVRLLLSTPLAALERFLIAQGLGLGALSLLTLSAGAFLGVSPGLAVAFAGAGMALTAVELMRWLKRRPFVSPEVPGLFAALSPLEWTLAGISAYSALIHLIGALGPETFYDSLVYHLAAPNLYRLRGAIVPVEGILHANFPQNMEMLYLLGLLLRGETLAKLLHFWMMMLSLGAVYGIGRTGCSRRTGLAACALFSTIPVVAVAVWHTGVEAGLAFWSLMGVWAFVRGIYSRADAKTQGDTARWLLLSGLFHGLALGVKYTAVWNAGASAALIVFWLRKEHTLARFDRLRLAAVWALAAFVVFAPWLVKNTAFTGNPLYPFLRGVFGPDGPYPDAAALTDTARGHFWYGGLSDWRSFIVMPWKMFLEGRSPFSFIGPVLVAFAPLATGLGGATFPFGWLLAAFGLQYGAWLGTTSMIRFFIPALPLLCLYAAHTLTRWGRDFRAWAPWLPLPVLLWNLAWNGAMLNEKEIPGVVFGRESRESFLSRTHLGYSPSMADMSRFLRDTLPADAKLLVVGDARTAFLPRDHAANTVFDRSELLEKARESAGPEELYASLRASGFTHLLVNYPETQRLLVKRLAALDHETLRLLSRFFRGCLRPVLRNGHDVALYRLVAPPPSIRPAASPAELPEIVLIALSGDARVRGLAPESRARVLMSLAN